MRSLPLLAVLFVLGASVGGNRAPDGTEINCDLPGDLHRRNTTSRGQGCCVWTSIHHAALFQNVPGYQEAPKWIQQHGIPGGAWSGSVQKYLPQMAKERGYMEPPAFLNYEGNDLEILKLACRTGRMPGITYSFSPTGRYGGSRIAHMTNLVGAAVGKGPDGRGWWVVLDNNFPGSLGKEDTYEWMSEAEFRRTFSAGGQGWAVVLLTPPPPPVPKN
ncbi:MAG: hypothetical protein AB7K24_04500 [Gemmataceae bacterium]